MGCSPVFVQRFSNSVTEYVHASLAADAVAHVFVAQLAESVELESVDAHHLGRVRRLRRGEILTASTGDGHWRSYEVADSDVQCFALQSCGEVQLEAPASVHLTIAPALIPKARFDDAVVAMVELGVDRVLPLMSERCVVRWDANKSAAAMQRLRVLAREAAMQCRRSYLPTIDGAVTTKELAGTAGLLVAAFRADSADGANCDDPALDIATSIRGLKAITVATGPEGGFSDRDLENFAEFRSVRLGPHVLRAETASVAAAALVRMATMSAAKTHPATATDG